MYDLCQDDRVCICSKKLKTARELLCPCNSFPPGEEMNCSIRNWEEGTWNTLNSPVLLALHKHFFLLKVNTMAGLEFSVVVVYIYFFIVGKSQISPWLNLFTMETKFLKMAYKAFYNLITCFLL